MKFSTLPKARSRHLLLSFAAFVWLALPAASSGCGQDRACFEWSQAKGACPAQDMAKSFMASPSCPGDIASVDSPPTFENDLCCYAVTKQESVPCSPAPPDASSCLRCGQAAATPNVDLSTLCQDSLMTFNNLKFCACSTTCASACSADFCAGAAMGAACSACLNDVAMGCGDPWNLCMAN